MSLSTVKHFISNLTTGMSDLVAIETVPWITSALGYLTTERDTLCPSSQ